MNKVLVFLLLIPILVLSGCSFQKEDEEKVTNEDLTQILQEWQEEKERELDDVCSQPTISSEYISDCYFHSLKDCESDSGAIIPREDIDKCVPVIMKEYFEKYYF